MPRRPRRPRRFRTYSASMRHRAALHSILWLNSSMLESPGIAFTVFAFLLVLRSDEHTSELQSLMRISYAVFCLNKKLISSNLRDPFVNLYSLLTHTPIILFLL